MAPRKVSTSKSVAKPKTTKKAVPRARKKPGPKRKPVVILTPDMSTAPSVGSGKLKTEEQWCVFLNALQQTANVTHSAALAHITRQAVYDRRLRDPAFALDFDAAYSCGVEAWEDEAARRAFKGYDEPVFYKGDVVGYKRNFSDTLAMFILKGAKPDKFRDRVSTDNLNTNLDVETTAEEADAIREEIRAKLFG
jgi:hypothetical protein